MGASSSVQQPSTSLAKKPSTRAISTVDSQKRQRLLDLQVDDENDSDHLDSDLGSSENKDKLAMDAGTEGMIYQALVKILHLEDKQMSHPLMQKLLNSLDRSYFAKNVMLMHEGEIGNKLFIIESGKVQITIDSNPIRVLERGAVFGELALFYDAPRSATASTMTGCVVWSLHRKVFKSIQKDLATSSHLKRVSIVKNIPQFSHLKTDLLTEMISSFEVVSFEAEEDVIAKDAPTAKIYLVESGVVGVHITPEMAAMSVDALCEKLAVRGPPLPESTSSKSDKDLNSEKNSHGPFVFGDKLVLGAGCVFGLGSLFGKANMQNGWPWKVLKKKKKAFTYAESPYLFSAMEPTTCSYFSVAKFEEIFGPCEVSLSSSNNQVQPPLSSSPSKHFDRHREKFEGFDDFDSIDIIGDINMGTVAVACRYLSKGDSCLTDKEYILKVLSKEMVAKSKQVKHVLREASILYSLRYPFVALLEGKFQNPDQLIFVLERLTGGDLWHMLYENKEYKEYQGFPFEMVKFYVASLVLALGYLRSQGIAYRNLKPENVMLDSKGYIRLVGFGFAKVIPYRDEKAKSSSGAKVSYQYKTYTLCGTPEYMAPEIVSSVGHDHTVDNWALGVLIHEICTCTTPFSDNTPEKIFGRIAMVFREEVPINKGMFNKYGDKAEDIVSFILQLLQPRPSERLIFRYGDMNGAFGQELFTNFDWEGLRDLRVPPTFLPPPTPKFESKNKSIPFHEHFRGNDRIYEEF